MLLPAIPSNGEGHSTDLHQTRQQRNSVASFETEFSLVVYESWLARRTTSQQQSRPVTPLICPGKARRRTAKRPARQPWKIHVHVVCELNPIHKDSLCFNVLLRSLKSILLLNDWRMVNQCWNLIDVWLDRGHSRTKTGSHIYREVYALYWHKARLRCLGKLSELDTNESL